MNSIIDTQAINFNQQKVNSIPSNSANQETVYSEPIETNDSQVESVTVSRTPPWRKNYNLGQQQQTVDDAQTVENTNVLDPTNRIPPLALIQLQPPWQDETQKRRINPKRRPNFKEDPTGYLGIQLFFFRFPFENERKNGIPYLEFRFRDSISKRIFFFFRSTNSHFTQFNSECAQS